MNKDILYIGSKNGLTDKFSVKPLHPPSYRNQWSILGFILPREIMPEEHTLVPR